MFGFDRQLVAFICLGLAALLAGALVFLQRRARIGDISTYRNSYKSFRRTLVLNTISQGAGFALFLALVFLAVGK